MRLTATEVHPVGQDVEEEHRDIDDLTLCGPSLMHVFVSELSTKKHKK